MRTLLCIAIGLTGTLTYSAQAQVQRSGNADARVAQQLQQLTSERSALQAENAKLKQELERVQAELKKSTTSLKSLESRSRALEVTANRGSANAQQTEEQLERTRAQLQELVGKFRETAETLRDIESERGTLKGQLAGKERELKTCIDRNAALYNLNVEVLDRMENRGFWANVAEREPFMKLKRVELENLIDDYRYRVDELRIEQQQQQQARQ